MPLKPAHWASLVPRNPAEQKPNHYLEMARVAWENRGQLPFAWRILGQGTCDGCAPGTTGLRDWTLEGIHLCMVRLELMRLDTMPALDPARLADVAALRPLRSKDLRALGRLPEPMIRRKGDRGFRDVDNSARLCHAASTVAMKRTVGYGATTCSYTDWIGSDLIVFFGSNTPNNQRVTMKYLYHARRKGAKVAVVKPYFEPGLKRYWVPSVPDSAVFGTKFADCWFPVDTGGDLAFLNGVLKVLTAEGWVDHDFNARSTTGFAEAAAHVAAQDWETLEAESGTSRATMRRFAEMLRDAKNGIFVWSMGLTQHAHGVDTVQALMNVGLARGWVGREKAGMMPIRGHSGVQGGAEVGCAPGLEEPHNTRFAQVWGFPCPSFKGLTASEMVDAADRGALDAFWMVGGNFMETLPDPAAVAQGPARVGTRIHQDIVASSMMPRPRRHRGPVPVHDALRVARRGTETSTERRIIFSPEVPGRRIGSAKPEWEVFGEVAARVRPDRAEKVRFSSSQQIRDEIARAVPLYAGIERLSAQGDQFQWGGPRLLADGVFNTPDGKARFTAVTPPHRRAPEGMFHVSTRRGKQFSTPWSSTRRTR